MPKMIQFSSNENETISFQKQQEKKFQFFRETILLLLEAYCVSSSILS